MTTKMTTTILVGFNTQPQTSAKEGDENDNNFFFDKYWHNVVNNFPSSFNLSKRMAYYKVQLLCESVNAPNNNEEE